MAVEPPEPELALRGWTPAPVPPWAWAVRAATNLRVDTDSPAAHFDLLPRETWPQFSAIAPALCSATNTEERFPSARSGLPGPASAAPLPCWGAEQWMSAMPFWVRVLRWPDPLSAAGSRA